MYTITGVTGHVGGATARELLNRDAPVRAVVRDPAKRAAWEERGARTAIADFHDERSLTEALKGSLGAFVMLPTIATAGDAGHRRLADSIAAAVAESEVPHVVLLSSIAADQAAGTGPIRWLHHLETRLRETGVRLSAIRPCHFQEKVETVLGAVVGEGVYPVFGETADAPTPMIATRDIGEVAAEALLAPPSRSEVVDLDGPAYSEQDVADRLAALLGRPLQVVTIPRDGWVDAMTESGLPVPFAHELAAMYDAEHRGLFRPCGDRRRTGTTPIDRTLRHVIEAATGHASAT
ncbi:NAD(P)H-binding protein [Spirillospora sp. NPDC052242]